MTRYARILVKKFWGFCALVLIVTAVLVQLGRELSPLVGEYREAYSRYLSNMLGVEVTIDQLSARWSGLRPQLQLRGLHMENAQGEPILSVADATAQLGLLRSLAEWRLSWGQLFLANIEMGFVQNEDGKWNLAGLPESTASVDPEPGVTIDDPLDVFLFGRYIELQDAKLKFQFRTGHKTSIQVPSILLENSPDFHRLTASLVIDKAQGERHDGLQLVLEGEGDPRNADSFHSRGYVQLRGFPLEKLMAALPGERWKNLPDGEWREGHTLDLQLWLSSLDNLGFRFQGSVKIDGVPLELPSEMVLPQHLAADVSGHWLPERGWQVALQNTIISWDDNESPAFNLAVSGDADTGPVVSCSKLEIEPWVQLANKYGFVKGKLKTVLDTLKPRGTLHNIQVQMNSLAEKLNFSFRANLEKLAVNAWKGAPALEGVDGYIELTRDGGFIDIDSTDGFMMHYKTVYKQPMRYASMSGQVAWQLRPDDNAIYINSGPLSLRNENEIVDGYFHIYLPWRKGSAPSNMVLQIGLQNTLASNHSKYVPFTVPDSVRSWLNKSLDKGDVSDGGFIYNGSLAKGHVAGRALQLYLDIHNASLDYHDDWPGLTDINGLLLMDNRELSVNVESAHLYDSRVGPALITLAPNPEGEKLLLDIKGSVAGSAEDGLRVLRESRLRNYIHDSFDSWSIAGQLQTNLNLSIPLDADEPGMRQQVDVNLVNASLQMEKPQLQFEKLHGRISYISGSGLNAINLAGRLWQQSVNIGISSPANDRGGRDTLINMQGSVDTGELAQWSGRPELLFANGNLRYQAQLMLPAAGEAGDGDNEGHSEKTMDNAYAALLNVSSDLEGVAIALPAPYGKTAEQSRLLQVQVPIAKDHTLYDIRYTDLVHALFLIREGQMQNASVGLGQNAILPQQRAFQISGKPQRLVVSEWKSVLERYEQYQQAIDRSLQLRNDALEPLVLEPVFDLDIKSLQISALELASTHVRGKHIKDIWQLQMQSKTLTGNLTWFDDKARAAVLDLEYLRLPKRESESELESVEVDPPPYDDVTPGRVVQTEQSVDPFADWDPADSIAVDFTTKEFSVGGQSYGSWAFKLRPTRQGLVAKDLTASIKGVELHGIEADKGAELRWERRDGDIVSKIRGRIVAKDFAGVMKAWGQPKLLESKTAVFDVELSWPGSPAALGVKKLSGSLYMNVKKGRFFSDSGTANNPLLRLIGLFNFDTWARRLELDFSDLLKGGMAYDKISGQMKFNEGFIYLTRPVKVKTPSSSLQMAGSIDMNKELLDATLVATLPVGGNLTLITAIAAGLPAAAGVYVVSKIFKKQVDKVASASYRMTGPWSDPVVAFERLFDDKAAKRAGEDTRKEAEANGKQPEPKSNRSTDPPTANLPFQIEQNSDKKSM